MNAEKIDRLVKILWDYSVLHHKIEKADVIIVFGSYNPIVSQRAAELYKGGYAPIVVFSGNRSDSTNGWEKTEAETLASVAEKHGLPKDRILLETKAKNTGENITFSRDLLENHGIKIKKIIVVQKPYSERRVFASVRKRWQEIEVMVTSPKISLHNYLATSPIGRDASINTIVGDVQRISLYSKKGYQIPQEIPNDVKRAYEELINMGYNKALA